ncbi:MAG: acetoacetate--CoA ligase [Actinomycetales bacterium mxb001]|nr:MAG: acetoacetate--CoA ligase [Actinomycetales bacterium mxb001]
MARVSEPAWVPDPQRPTRVAAFADQAGRRVGRDLSTPEALHAWSIEDPDAFWSAVWDFLGVVGERSPVAAEPAELPDARFFPGARLNLAENYLHALPDREGQPLVVQTAEVGDGVGIVASIDRDDLVSRVAETAALLRSRGISPGDRVVLVLPVGIDALVVTLGALAVGATVASASPEFGVPAIIDRFGQLDPVVLVATTSYRWNGKRHDRRDHLVELVRDLPSVTTVLVVPGADDPTSPVDPDVVDLSRLAARFVAGTSRLIQVDLLHEAQRRYAGAEPQYLRLPFDHPAYVLFSSGTTGKPKSLVHRAGGALLKHLVEAGLHADVGPGDRLPFFTTTGWMMWNWEISTLATGATLVLHDGAPTFPTVDALFDVAELAELTHLGLGARLVDGMRADRARLRNGRDLTDLRMVLVTGSPLTEPSAQWLVDELGPGVMPNPISGGTDLVGCFLAGTPTRAFYAGELPGPALAMDVDVYDEAGHAMSDDSPGELICRNTFPTVPLRIWGDDDGSRLRATYFERYPGVWTHGDLTSKLPSGGFVIHGRSDATLNVAGVRIGTGEIYAALEHVPEVIDALAFAQAWQGDTRMVLLVVLASGAHLDDALRDRIRATLRERGSPRHVPAVVLAVDELPRTLTGKLAEIAVADTVNGRPVRNRDALGNPQALDAIAAREELRS